MWPEQQIWAREKWEAALQEYEEEQQQQKKETSTHKRKQERGFRLYIEDENGQKVVRQMAEYGINEYAKLDDYQPTAAEQRLLQVLLDPANVGKSITEKCQLAGVSRETYYAAMRKEGFVRLKNQLTYDLLKANIDEVLKATFKYALNNAKNHADRKLLLEMYGWYIDKKNVEVTGKDGEPIQIAQLSEEEKKELLKNVAKRVVNEDESVSDLQNSS